MNVSIHHPTGQANFSRVRIDDLVIWFSYETPIAFSKDYVLTIRKNEWGPTTGKHLNFIREDHSVRIDGDAFGAALEAVLNREEVSA